ncbi:MAG TPA: hypothetical protein VGC42_15455 [Kofleriaceae bacterium]
MALVALTLAACSSDDTHYVVVTVTGRPAVHDAAALVVSLANAGTTRMDSLKLDGSFPESRATFSVSSPGRTGALDIAIDATDAAGLVVGHGTATAQLTDDGAAVQLDTTDFVVNTDYAGDQYPDRDYEASGFQLAAVPGGPWTVAFEDACPTNSCSLYARRFDAKGVPASTALAAGTNAFALNTSPTTYSSIPAVASTAAVTVALWDYYDPASLTIQGIACRPFDTAGRATSDQTSTAISNDSADVVSVAALATGNFAAAWNTLVSTNEVIRAQIVKPDCTPLLAAPLTVSTGTIDARRADVGASGDNVLFTWIVDGNLHARLATSAGVLAAADLVPVAKSATQEVAFARIAPGAAGGFVIAVRWAQITGNGPGRIDLYRMDATGKLLGTPTLVTDKSASEDGAPNDDSFAIAHAADGTVLVAWHACGTQGDGSMCGVFGQYLEDSGETVGGNFVIPTTTENDQEFPSVVALDQGFAAAWSDASGKAPDVAGKAARARILYPPTP